MSSIRFVFSPAARTGPCGCGRDRRGTEPFASTIIARHPGPVYGLIIPPDRRTVASAGGDGFVQLFDLSSGAVRRLGGFPAGVQLVSFSDDGRWLAGAGYDGTLLLYDAHDLGASPRALRGHTRSIDALAFVGGGRMLVSGGQLGELWAWETQSGAGRPLKGRVEDVGTLAASPDGRHVASGGLDSKVFVWDLGNGIGRSLLGHRNLIEVVAFSPDGAEVVSASQDFTARVWKPPRPEPTMLVGHAR